ncbi:putative Helicase, type I site-specific restriction-modification system restriction subunit [uncultured Desulfobacterium sp.]|uniref:Putative Helicase, type I site-specific restriction-modification system restriction subunit n=1 Tax=uncultured Desulfobacterium sp. TaxID=201089 RepID=A0A445N0C7_9BACT|nr:putative Helicase, type I site-specific restriction-modification system restriction subunit [uncultured Desulfobacterium sp.]
MTTEADARMVIDKLLESAGWCITNKAQVATEEAASDGRADYLLRDSRSRPLAVLEAKRFAVDPYTAKEQAKAYARTLGAPFVILSNGQDHYFWDYGDGDARPVMGFPAQADLERRANIKLHRKGDIKRCLELLPLPHRFTFRGEEIEAHPYQVKCLQKADEALIAGRRRMLFEMATGTGKTLTIAMLMKRWFKAAIISRVLFLVDRIELAKQAKETFDEYLRDWPTVILYGGKRSLEGQIVVGTLDTIATQLGGNGFGHGYFDLVVTDECHRSIYNTHRATLGHFDAIHIGLTATPNPGELHYISEHERRLVRNTYIFFDCWNSARKEGRPTFEYSIQQGITEGYLAKYRIYHAESVLTYEGAEWEGEEIKPGVWGRDVESEDRLITIIQEYYSADAGRSMERPRKTIVFSVSDKQASVLARLFNRLLTDEDCLRIAGQINRSPSQVRQDFARKITCYTNNGNPKPVIDEFKYDPLPIIAVSVDMLDTGYDQKDIENLVMLRPTKSPIKYAQMRGRGSRLCSRINKTEFIIYDFVGNSKRFNDPGEIYHKPRLVGAAPGAPISKTADVEETDTPPSQPAKPYPEGGMREFLLIAEGSLDDEIRAREIILVGPEGLAMDRKTYREEWEKKIVELKRTDPAVEKIFRGEELTDAEWEDLARRLNSPKYYFNDKTLRRAFEQPTGSLTDFIRVALGLDRFLTREERIERAFNTWVAEHSNSINPGQAQMLRLLKARVMTGEEITMRLFSQPPFSLWGGLTRMEQLFGKEQLLQMVDGLNALLAA